MKCLVVHPSPLMYTKIFLRLEPLGLELVAEAIRQAGHAVRIIDLQVETHKDYFKVIDEWKPAVVAFSCNYLANVPEIIDLAKLTKEKLPTAFVFVGGHSASFVARDFLEHGRGAIDCVLKGEGEAAVATLLLAVEHDRHAVTTVPGVVTCNGDGPPSQFVKSLGDLRPARGLLRHRRKYYIGVLDPCASIEFTRGCPWDCSFCSAWTFYGRGYRAISPEAVVTDLERIQEPGVFIVDDVAFIQAEHGLAIGEAVAEKGIKKQYYLETRGDVLLRNKDVLTFWKTLGLEYMFLGIEAIDEEGLKKHLGRAALKDTLHIASKHLLHGQTNFIKMLWKFNSVYNPNLQYADHQQPVKYEMTVPSAPQGQVDSKLLKDLNAFTGPGHAEPIPPNSIDCPEKYQESTGKQRSKPPQNLSLEKEATLRSTPRRKACLPELRLPPSCVWPHLASGPHACIPDRYLMSCRDVSVSSLRNSTPS